MTWNFNMEEAPRGETRMVKKIIGKNEVEIESHEPVQIIAAGNGGIVTQSYWIPKDARWCMFTADVPPLAWQPWPAHPHSAPSPPGTAAPPQPTGQENEG